MYLNEYCGIDLAKINPTSSKIKVCNGYDFYSSIPYKRLVEENKHLSFFEKVKNKYKFTDKEMGVLIRWLYRGMTLEQATYKCLNDRLIRKEIISKHGN